MTAAEDAATDRSSALWNVVNLSYAIAEFDPHGVILSVNANFAATFGYGRDQLVGRHHSILCAAAAVQSPAYLDFWARLRAAETVHGNFVRVRADGERLWLRATYNPVFAGDGTLERIVKVATDVTGAARLNAANKAKIAAVDRAQAIAEFALDGTILSANGNFLAMTGYRLDEVVGKRHRIFVPAAEAASVEYREFWQRLGGNELHSGVFRRLRKDGREIWLQATYNPVLDDDGKPLSVIKFATDITHQVELERKLQQKLDESIVYQDALAGQRADLDQLLVRVADIIRSISDIAAATKTLALNASIEAARAGSAGTGFGVVAREVGHLAGAARTAAASATMLMQSIGTPDR